jgi:hypothetical protein
MPTTEDRLSRRRPTPRPRGELPLPTPPPDGPPTPECRARGVSPAPRDARRRPLHARVAAAAIRALPAREIDGLAFAAPRLDVMATIRLQREGARSLPRDQAPVAHSDFRTERCGSPTRSQACPRAALLLRGLLFRLGVSVTSDEGRGSRPGGELTLFEAVGPGGLTSFCCVARRRSGMFGVT